MLEIRRATSAEMATEIVQPRRCWTPLTQQVTLVAAPILAAALGYGISIIFVSGAAIGCAVLAGALGLVIAANLIAWIKAPNERLRKVINASAELLESEVVVRPSDLLLSDKLLASYSWLLKIIKSQL